MYTILFQQFTQVYFPVLDYFSFMAYIVLVSHFTISLVYTLQCYSCISYFALHSFRCSAFTVYTVLVLRFILVCRVRSTLFWYYGLFWFYSVHYSGFPVCSGFTVSTIIVLLFILVL